MDTGVRRAKIRVLVVSLLLAVVLPAAALHFVAAPESKLEALAAEGSAGSAGAGAPMTTTTPTATVTATASVTPTEEAASPTPPPPTSTPAPAYLPIALKDEKCDPVEEHVDVVFVLDGSAYMKNFRRGKPAFETAREIIHWMIDGMDFEPNNLGQQDQAGIVLYRHRTNPLPEETLSLTRNKSEVIRTLDGFELGDPRDTARMDIGLLVAQEVVLADGRHRPGNEPVLVVVSEMQSKNVGNNYPGCEESDDHCRMLFIARDVRDRGITLAVFATGQDGRGAELMLMASNPSLAVFLPTIEDIGSVVAALAPRTPCPPELFWPKRP